MEFRDFQKIATYLNEINRGKFTESEVLESAQDYWEEYYASCKQDKPSKAMQSLCDELYQDMDYMDYMDLPPFMNSVQSIGELNIMLQGAVEMID